MDHTYRKDIGIQCKVKSHTLSKKVEYYMSEKKTRKFES